MLPDGSAVTLLPLPPFDGERYAAHVHVPDGFLDGKTSATAAVLATAGVGWALRHVQRHLPARRVPMLGLAAAFLFSAQMLNFPVAAGTSGHLMGGVLVAALLGPSAAIVVVSTVLVVQCLLFQDGGLLALGANVFNMAIVGAGGGGLVFGLLRHLMPGPRGRFVAVALAGWSSTVLAATACAGQLAWSHTVPWRAGFAAMAGVHGLIGIGEGLIGALVLAAVERTRPDLVLPNGPEGTRGGLGELVRNGVLVAVGLALFVAPFACAWPDGLEAVAERLGFAGVGTKSPLPGLAPEYTLPGVSSPVVATALAGAIGAVVVFVLAIFLARLLVPRSSSGTTPAQIP